MQIFSLAYGLSAIGPSQLVNGYDEEAKMVLVGAVTTIEKRLNIACGPARMQI